MKTLRVELPGRAYDIHIGRGLLDRAGKLVREVCPRAEKLFLVTDENVAAQGYARRLRESLEGAGFAVYTFDLRAGESTKCAEVLSALWEGFAAEGITRTDAVIALGGGVVGDLAGFAAATILRGVDFIQIPTTLLAQVDSSVGGKVAVDLAHGKNLAGAFWQPRLVVMDPGTLETLPDGVFFDGMAEVVKYGCIFDRTFFDFLRARPGRGEIMENIEHVLYTCCDLKRRVVVSDERDRGERMLLNFGHTVGHAYELAGGYETWTHGQAVAAGMCVAARLGVSLGLTPGDVPEQVSAAVAALGLPTHIPCSMKDYADAVCLDKKSAGSGVTVILLEEIGRAVAHRMPREQLLDLLNSFDGTP